MSRSYNTSDVFRVEPLTKVDRQLAVKAERWSVKVQLATGIEDVFFFRATWHSETKWSWKEVGTLFGVDNGVKGLRK